MNICLNCGNAFLKKSETHKFCSQKCGNSYWVRKNRKGNPKPKPKCFGICPVCGEAFEKTRKDKTFCSRNCAERRRCREKKQQARRQIQCPYCGACFEKSGEHRRFCSDKCRTRFHTRKYKREKREKAGKVARERRFLPVINPENLKNGGCPICGMVFKKTRKDQKYCSRKCVRVSGSRAARIRQKEAA